MEIKKAQLSEIEQLGELQFSIREIAIIMQLDEAALEKKVRENKIVRNAYERGRLKASAAVRKALLQLAKQGSSPAQKQMLELIDKAGKKKESAAKQMENLLTKK